MTSPHFSTAVSTSVQSRATNSTTLCLQTVHGLPVELMLQSKATVR